MSSPSKRLFNSAAKFPAAVSELLRVVFDVNVWVHGLVGPFSEYPYLPQVPPTGENSSADCLSLTFDGDRFSVFLSPHILRNVSKALLRQGASEATVERTLQDIVEMTHFSQGSVLEPERAVVAQNDFEDNLVLDLVLAANADVLVTADGEFLESNGWKGRAFLHPTAFVKLALAIKPA